MEFGAAPSIREILDGLETFRASREERIMKLGEVGADFKADEWGLEMFMPDASHKAFDRAEASLSSTTPSKPIGTSYKVLARFALARR